MTGTILQINNLTKSFSGIKALDGVQLTLEKGEVHALMGENGAGKSTFMKILIGLLVPDLGEIIFDGELIKNKTVSEISKIGISMIHQEILIIPELTVAQNIFLGREKEVLEEKAVWLNDRKLELRATHLLNELGIEIDANIKMKNLSVAQTQMVEIAKAVSNNARVIIMDEPTSAISDKEVFTLFKIIKDLKNKGVAIIYISHKIDEIFQICDKITVLRDGKYITTKSASDLDKNSLIAMMVGREISDMFPETLKDKGKVALSVKNLSKKGKFSNISFEVHAGEIFGISGLMGAGRTEIAEAIYGLSPADSGVIKINGEEVEIKSPREAMAKGIGYVSEDRKKLGFIPYLSVRQNLTLSSLAKYARGVFVNTIKENFVADRMISELQIKASDPEQKVTYLSGGNQQKVVIGKVIAASPQIIILDEPTRGVDVGAKIEIYKLINNLAAQGIAIIMISSELPEILGMSNRILVLSKGVQKVILSREEATAELVMSYAVH